MSGLSLILEALDSYKGPQSSWLIGEPCFPPPEALRQAYSRAALSERFGYSPQPGLPSLRILLTERHESAGQSLSPECIVVTNGAKSGLLAVFAAVLNPGDEIIHPIPAYPAYSAMAARIGARPIGVPENNGGFAGWAEKVASAISPQTRAVVISSPSNPTGATLSVSEAASLVEICRTRGIRLICDEAYIDFRFSDGSDQLASDYDPTRETVIQVRSTSKSWALCGWRIGWVVADQPLAKRISMVHAGLVNPASSPAQEALLALPEIPEDYSLSARKTVEDRVNALCTTIERGGLAVKKPEGGFYVWLDVRSLVDSDNAGEVAAWCMRLAKRHGIGLWPGEDYGGPGWVRLSATAPKKDDWQNSLATLTKALTP